MPTKAKASKAKKGNQNHRNQKVDLAPISDEQAAKKFEAMIVNAANLARKQAARSGRKTNLDDLIQVGWLAFFTAKRKWNPAKGVTLGAYCSIWVRGAISREIWAGREVWENSHGRYGKISVASDELRQSVAVESFLETADPLTRYVVDGVIIRNMRPELIAMRKRMLIGDVIEILNECLNWTQTNQ